MYLKIRGLVLRVVNYKDTDAILTLLTDRYGKVSVKARGVRRKNSPLVAACQLLSYGEFTIFEYRGMHTINEAQALDLFTPLRKDLCKLSLGTYFAQVAELISQEDMPNPELLSLVLNCLHALAVMNEPESKVKAVFELRSACIAGYTPDLSGCNLCGQSYPDRFDVSDGLLECSTCRRIDHTGIRLPLTNSILDAMRYICFCDSKRLFSFQAGSDTFELLSQITECYLSTQLERGFSALDFYKSLLVPFVASQE